MTGIPDGLLQLTVVVVRPVESTDAHNSTTLDYAAGTRTTLAPGTVNGGAWLQQDSRSETRPDGRTPAEQAWLLICNYADIRHRDRIEWASHPAGPVVFEVEGPPEPALTPGEFHHTEATLRIVDG
ncbi:MAG: hypothetical protein AAGE88_18180 [Actinomycetota bacterium]